MDSLQPHPIALEFPDIDAETWNDLKAGMRKDGFDPAHPIVLFEGMILDGRNRYRCVQSIIESGGKIKPVFREFEGTYEEAIAFSIRENLLRRHLTAGQRALIGDGLANIPRGGIGTIVPITNETQMTISVAAEKVHVAPKTIMRARQLKLLDPKAAERVKAGKETLNGALTKAKKAHAAPVKAPPQPIDEAGRRMHRRAYGPLTEGRQQFKALMREASALKGKLKALAHSDLGRLIHWQTAEVECDNLHNLLRFAAPYSSCPLGDPCPETCKLCRGTQWIGEQQYDGLPAKLKGAKK